MILSEETVLKGAESMAIQESGEMYLETIYILSQSGKGVRAIDVGERMGFSKPSVSRAMGILKNEGYVETDADGFLLLTEKGRATAERTYERHTVLRQLFIGLGVSEKTADEDACRIEHHISEETFEAFKRHAEAARKGEL